MEGNPVNRVDPSGYCIVQYSGEVRMGQYPYGTSGLCPHTGSAPAEAAYAATERHNGPGTTATEAAVGAGLLVGVFLLPEIAAGYGALQLTTYSASAGCLVNPVCAQIFYGVSNQSNTCSTCAAEEVNTGTNVVYRYVQNGTTRYVGITNDFARRLGEHARRGWQIESIPGLQNLSRCDARAVEQVLIESYGLMKNGGTLLNQINSIAPTNSAYQPAIQRGQDILTQIGFIP